jgi:hypothetical protein
MIFRSDTADPLQCGSSYDASTVTVQNGWTKRHLPVTNNRNYISSSSSSCNDDDDDNNNAYNKHVYNNYE